ncbi:PepSY-like domain-containing protein [Rufibacter immobilis]|nr:PepSY-like domain-containing protein [Rufibacter immobilis]
MTWLSMLALSGLLMNCTQRINMSNLPSVVQNSLKNHYPAATNPEWEKKGDHFEAEFDIQGQEHTVLIDASGQVLMRKQDVATAELPQPVSGALQRDYQAYLVDDVEKVEKNGQTYYQVELENNNQDLKKVYALDGSVADVPYWD